MEKKEFDKIISEMKKSQKKIITKIQKEDLKKTDQDIQNEIKFKNENPDLFKGTIFEQMLKKLNLKKGD